jgi:hypothetical protein
LFLFAALKLYSNLPWEMRGRGNFPPFYSAGLIIKDGARHALYDKAEQQAVAYRLFPSEAGRWKRFPYFYHAPYEAALLAPLAYLPYRAALLVWMALGVGAVLLSAHLLNPLFPEVRRWTGVPLGLVFLAFWPIWEASPYGQDSLFVLLFLALGFRLYCDRRDFVSGAALSLGLFKFQYIIPTVGLLFLRRRIRLAAGAILVGALMLLVSWVLIGNSGMAGFAQLLRDHPSETEWQMVNVRGLVDSLRGVYSPLFTVLLSLPIVAWGVFAKTRDRAQEFCLAILVTSLVSFHMHMYDMVVLLIPVLVVLEGAIRNRSGRQAILPAIFFCALLEPVSARFRIEYLWSLPILGLLATLAWPTAAPAEDSHSASEHAPPLELTEHAVTTEHLQQSPANPIS